MGKILQQMWTGLAIVLMKAVLVIYGKRVPEERRAKVAALSQQWKEEWKEL